MRCAFIAVFGFVLCLGGAVTNARAQSNNSQNSNPPAQDQKQDQKDKQDQKNKQDKSSEKKQDPSAKQANPPDAPAPANDTPSPQQSSTGTQTPPDGRRHTTAEDNPFPEDASKKAASPSQQQPVTGEQAPPDGRRHTTAEDNPFPEDQSKKAAAAAAPASEAQPDGDSSSLTGLDKLDLEGAKEKEGRHKLKLTAPESGQPYDPKLAENDDRIGDFYLKTGDFAGAYGRFKEACAADPGDGRAVFGLAEAARKMNRTKEAADNYQVYLDAFPDGPKAKAARKALSELKIPATKP